MLKNIESPKITNQQLDSMRDAFEESDSPYKYDVVLEEDLAPEYQSDVEKNKVILKKII